MMLPAALLALAQRLLYGCRDPVTGERLYAGLPAEAILEDVEEAARYLRACAEAKPVATVRVHDTGGNAGIAWSGVPTENAGVMRGGTPLYEHPQPASAQAEVGEALRELVDALDGAFISSWQSTAAWQTQLDRARAVLAAQGGADA